MKSKTVEERARRLLDSLGPLEYTKEAVAMRWIEADLRAVEEEARRAALEEAAALVEDEAMEVSSSFRANSLRAIAIRIRALAERKP